MVEPEVFEPEVIEHQQFRFSLRHRQLGVSMDVVAATRDEACSKLGWQADDVVMGRQKLIR